MRFNKEDLIALASQSSQNYDKEGVLILREKSSGFFRRTEGSRRSKNQSRMKRDSFSCVGPYEPADNSELWFRLSGNLLFYLKTNDPLSEPLGLIVLESCTIKVDTAAPHSIGFHFVIEFESGGYHWLAASTETERVSWMDALRQASFGTIRAKLRSLKAQVQSQLSLRTGTDSGIDSKEGTPIDEPSFIKASGYVKDVSESPLYEISLLCDNLLCDNRGGTPSAKICVHVRNMPGQNWVKYASTEVVQRSSNPVFFTTISFRESDGLTVYAEARFSIYNVRERVTGTQTMIGHLIINLGALNAIQRIRLPISSSSPHPGSTPHNHVGFLTIIVWNLEREDRGSTESTPCRSISGQPKLSRPFNNSSIHHQQQQSEDSSDSARAKHGRIETPIGTTHMWTRQSSPSWRTYSHRRTQSLPPRLGSKLKIPLQDNFGLLFNHPFMQTYRFHSGLGGDIFSHEIMAESKLCFIFPQQLLSLWIAEEKELLQEMIGLGELLEPWHSVQVRLIERHLRLINIYSQARTNLLHYKGADFKPSSTKDDPTYEFVPLNLHLQRIWAQNESLHKNGFHDVITVGAFTATSQGFKEGGLQRMIQRYANFDTIAKQSEGQRETSSWYLSNKVNMSYDSVQGIKRLRKEIVERMQLIMKFAKEKKTNGLHRFVEDIYHRCRLLLSVCDQTMIEEAFDFLEHQKVNLPTSTSLDFDKPTTSTARKHVAVDEGVDIVNSPLRNSVELFKRRADVSKELPPTEHLTPDSGLGIEDVIKSFLDSPSSNYYRPTEEPEPWELIQLNIEASVISLNSKVITLGGQGADVSFSSFRLNNPIQRAQSVMTHLNSANHRLTPGSWRKSLRDELPSSVTSSEDNKKEGKPQLKLHIPKPTETAQVATTSISISNKDDWCEELRGSLKKLRLATDGLLKTARLTHSVSRLQENPDKSNLGFVIKYRRDVCFSQALTSLVTALMGHLWCRKPDAAFLYVLTRLGPLVTFHSYLTYHADEAEMFLDMKVAIEDLNSVEFVLSLYNSEKGLSNEATPEFDSGDGILPVPKVSGSRSNLKVILPVPGAIFAMLPMGNSRSASFVVKPIFFSIGVNEFATYAERFKSLEPQEESNIESYANVVQYYHQFKSLNLPLKYNASKRIANPEPSIAKLLESLHTELYAKKKKNIEIFHLSEMITRLMMGFRFSSCKSGKDRTSMAATLEQVNTLWNDYDLSTDEIQLALDTMRSEGTRRENTLKNVGKKKFAFNSFQIFNLPKALRPPPGTFGNVQT